MIFTAWVCSPWWQVPNNSENRERQRQRFPGTLVMSPASREAPLLKSPQPFPTTWSLQERDRAGFETQTQHGSGAPPPWGQRQYLSATAGESPRDNTFKVTEVFSTQWPFCRPRFSALVPGPLLCSWGWGWWMGEDQKSHVPTWPMRTENHFNTSQASRRPTLAATESHSLITEANDKWLFGLTRKRMEAIKKMMRCLLFKINISGSQEDEQSQSMGMWMGPSTEQRGENVLNFLSEGFKALTLIHFSAKTVLEWLPRTTVEKAVVPESHRAGFLKFWHLQAVGTLGKLHRNP